MKKTMKGFEESVGGRRDVESVGFKEGFKEEVSKDIFLKTEKKEEIEKNNKTKM